MSRLKYVHVYSVCISVAASPGQVKLTGGSSPQEGLVQVRLYNRWGTICNDNFGVREASIICQMLGHSKYAF